MGIQTERANRDIYDDFKVKKNPFVLSVLGVNLTSGSISDPRRHHHVCRLQHQYLIWKWWFAMVLIPEMHIVLCISDIQVYI